MNKKIILMIGGSGFIGSSLGSHLVELGFSIRLLSRKKVLSSHLNFPYTLCHWDGLSIPEEALSGVFGMVNLAGESIADRKWSKEYKEKLISSRLHSTRALTSAVLAAKEKPKVVIQASAIGFYNMEDPSRTWDESSPGGSDFLGELCFRWEKEAAPLKDHTRLCVMRLGVVMSLFGGAFSKIMKIYRLGLGAVLGSGKQWMNWIHIEDVIQFVERALCEESFSGVYNLVAEENITNADFHKSLSQKTLSFSKLKIPPWVLSMALGDQAQLMITGSRIKPKALIDAGFKFHSIHIS